MSTVIPVSADWLTLREDADGRSRSRGLAMRAGRMLRPPVVVHDLGSGTGSMARWCAPLLPGPQTWVLHDWNGALLELASTSAPHDGDGRPVAVRSRVGPLGRLAEVDLAEASLITASALLDVLSVEDLAAVVSACVGARVPVLFALTVTGNVSIDPVDAGDRVFEAAFNDHQRRSVAGRRLLGPDAVAAAADLFRAAGWSVRIEHAHWRLDGRDAALAAEWMAGWLAAAVAARPALEEWAVEYAKTRAAQQAAGELRIVVEHADLLAWPP